MNLYLTLLAVVLTASASQAATNNILCYYQSWASGRTGNGMVTANDIPANKCSHLVYAFLLPAWDGSIQWFNDAALKSLIQLKSQNSKLKVLAAVGGWSAGSSVFSALTVDSGLRSKFIQNLYNIVNQYNLDGIDIDWEYPATNGGAAYDNVNYIQFLKELRAKLGNKVITAAIGASQSLVGPTYNVAAMNQYLDFFNMMTYDFHGAYDGATGVNSPLYANSIYWDKTLNSDAAINKFIASGASPSKILLGLGFYGQNFNLYHPENHGVGAGAGCGGAGPYTGTAGLLSYLEICENIKQGGWSTVYDNQQQAVYSYKGAQWVGYDNVDSIKAKANYAISKGLGGVMMWSIDYDDVHNSCGQGPLPLLSALNSVIKH